MFKLFIVVLAAMLGSGLMFFDAAISAEYFTAMLFALTFTYFIACLTELFLKRRD